MTASEAIVFGDLIRAHVEGVDLTGKPPAYGEALTGLVDAGYALICDDGRARITYDGAAEALSLMLR